MTLPTDATQRGTFDSTAEVALRQELASIIHSRLRTRVAMALHTAEETAAPTAVRARLKQVLMAVDETIDEALGHPGTSDLDDLLWRHSRQFAGQPELVIEDCPALTLSPIDYDLTVEVLLNLATNSELAGATHVHVHAHVTQDEGQVLILTIRDNGPGLEFDPWNPDRPGGTRRSSHILLQRLDARSGSLRRLPVESGTVIEARWRLPRNDPCTDRGRPSRLLQ